MRSLAQAAMAMCALSFVGANSSDAQMPANAWDCPQNGWETDQQWYDRCTAILNAPMQASFDMAKLRATFEKQPALPAERNRLLGRWQQAATARPNPNDLFGQLNELIGNAGCTALFGEGTVEFRADRWIVTDADGATDLGAVSYREGKDNVLFVLPQQGVQLLPVELEAADRFSLLVGGAPCVMVRANAAAANSAATPAAKTPVRTVAGTAPTLAVGPDAGGYACPDGRKLYVKSCFNESPQADCAVVNMHLPPSSGFQVETLDQRARIAASVSQCTVHPLEFRDGTVSLKMLPSN